MASDISKLIQDSFTVTLNGLLAKDASILEITKAHTKDLENTQLLQVKSTFDFSNFSSDFSYYIPAQSASLIFNTMMGASTTELSNEIDDDAEDAIGEFISNTSGGLTTIINGAELEDVGQTKFNISHKEILQGEDIAELDTTYRFRIKLEDQELIIFVLFDNTILPYIQEITSSKVTEHQEEIKEEIEEEIEEEVTQNVEEKSTKIKDNTSKDINKSTNNSDEKKDLEDSSEKNNEENEKLNNNNDEDAKNKKLKIIVIAVGSLLTIVLVVFLVMYFMGFFDPKIEDIKQKDQNATKIIKDSNNVKVVKYTTLKKVNFKSSQIDKERINEKLTELTKFKILTEEEIETQKLAEKNRLFELEKENKLIEFSKRNQEEPIINKEKKENLTSNNETNTTENNISNNKETFTIIKDDVVVINNETKKEDIVVQKEEETIPLLNYVVTNSLKYSLFKSLVQQTNTTQARISICNNKNGKTTIYIGPFENKELQIKMIELINKSNVDITSNTANISEEEFNLRCNLE